MTVCCNKLWKLLTHKNMEKKDLRPVPVMSAAALAKPRPAWAGRGTSWPRATTGRELIS